MEELVRADCRLAPFTKNVALTPLIGQSETIEYLPVIFEMIQVRLSPQLLLPRADMDATRRVISVGSIYTGCEHNRIQSLGQFLPVRQNVDEGVDIPLLQHMAIAWTGTPAVHQRDLLGRVVVVRGVFPVIFLLNPTGSYRGVVFLLIGTMVLSYLKREDVKLACSTLWPSRRRCRRSRATRSR